MSLAEKLAALITPEPGFQDPENDNDDTSAKVASYAPEEDNIQDTNYLPSDERARSKLRVQNANLDGDGIRYAGKKTSRKARSQMLGEVSDNIENDDDISDVREHAAAELGFMFEGYDEDIEDDTSSDENDELGVENDGENFGNSDGSLDPENSKDFTFEVNSDDFGKFGDTLESGSSEEESDGEKSSEELDEELTVLPLNENAAKEIAKGRAVLQQLKIWDKLLEIRILQQKMVSKVNCLPVGDYWDKLLLQSDIDTTNLVKETQSSLKNMLNDLLLLENVLDWEAEQEPPTKRKKLADFSDICNKNHNKFIAERNQTIEKWNDKTRVTSGGKNSFASMETSTLQQIEQILSNKKRLIDRTRIKRGNYSAVGRSTNIQDGLVELDPNIYDDDDFYHQLLRDLIERKTHSDSEGSQLTRQWLEVQKLRTKLKKKVDTKASKGRKIRFDIHAKMINFMAPVYGHSEREETKNELFSSLFGTRKN